MEIDFKANSKLHKPYLLSIQSQGTDLFLTPNNSKVVQFMKKTKNKSTLIKWCNAVPTTKTRSYYIIAIGHQTSVASHL